MEATFTSKRARVRLESRLKPVFVKLWSEACSKLESQVFRVLKYSKKTSDRKEMIIRNSIYVHFMSDFRQSYMRGVRGCSLSAATLRYIDNSVMQDILKSLQLSESDASLIEKDAEEDLGVFAMGSTAVS